MSETFNKTTLPDNPYKTWLVKIPMKLKFQLPNEDTWITIDTVQDQPCYGKDLKDAELHNNLEKHIGGSRFHKQELVKQIREALWNITHEDIEISYGESEFELMDDERFDKFESDMEERENN